MVLVGWVFRVEVTSSTIIHTDQILERIKKALESEPEIEKILIEDLYEPLKLYKIPHTPPGSAEHDRGPEASTTEGPKSSTAAGPPPSEVIIDTGGPA